MFVVCLERIHLDTCVLSNLRANCWLIVVVHAEDIAEVYVNLALESGKWWSQIRRCMKKKGGFWHGVKRRRLQQGFFFFLFGPNTAFDEKWWIFAPVCFAPHGQAFNTCRLQNMDSLGPVRNWSYWFIIWTSDQPIVLLHYLLFTIFFFHELTLFFVVVLFLLGIAEKYEKRKRKAKVPFSWSIFVRNNKRKVRDKSDLLTCYVFWYE